MSEELRLPGDWAEALSAAGVDLHGVAALVEQVYCGNDHDVYPPKRDVFRALELTPLKDVRVVILGQDPYPQEGNANGLAFSVSADRPLPKSLRTIYRKFAADLQLPLPSNGDLSPWAERGVLLLNTTLTVEAGKAGSSPHRRHWRHFTDGVLRAVNERAPHVAFLLWGRHAIDKAAAIGMDESRHVLIRSAHPAARGRSRERKFAESRPFSEANAFLKDNGLSEVDWSLP